MSDALELRKNRAWTLQGRMYADAEKAGNGELTPPGKRVVHNPEFIGYFVWKVARIPYPFHSVPPPQDKIDFSSHYGEPLGLFEVTPFLEKLTGADYESGFDVAADEVAYIYIHNLIEDTLPHYFCLLKFNELHQSVGSWRLLVEAGHFGDYQKQKILEINELLLGFGRNLAVSTKILQEPKRGYRPFVCPASRLLNDGFRTEIALPEPEGSCWRRRGTAKNTQVHLAKR